MFCSLTRRQACVIVGLVSSALFAASLSAAEPILWNVDNLKSIGGHKVSVVGEPRVVETDAGKAVAFDGVDDALFVDANPLAGLEQFTVEVVFRPASGGPREQRFLHFQPADADDRVLFETRLFVEGEWFLDTYVQTAVGRSTLFAEQSPHPLGPWYHAALVVDGRTMRHFVNGKQELESELTFRPLAAGGTSLGVRYNKVHWFQGAIRQIRVSPQVLKPAEFLKP